MKKGANRLEQIRNKLLIHIRDYSITTLIKAFEKNMPSRGHTNN